MLNFDDNNLFRTYSLTEIKNIKENWFLCGLSIGAAAMLGVLYICFKFPIA